MLDGKIDSFITANVIKIDPIGGLEMRAIQGLLTNSTDLIGGRIKGGVCIHTHTHTNRHTTI